MKFPRLQLKLQATLVAASIGMILIGCAVSSYGPSIAHNFPLWVISSSWFSWWLVGVGCLGLALYLSKALFNPVTERLSFRLGISTVFLGFMAPFLLVRSPMFVAWSVTTIIFIGISIFLGKDSTTPSAKSTLIPYVSSILLIFGLATTTIGTSLFQSTQENLLGVIAVVAGMAGWLVVIFGSHKAENIIRPVLALVVTSMIVHAVLGGHPLIHALVLAPIVVVLMLYPIVSTMRFGKWVIPEGADEKTIRVWQFQDITELNAWGVFLFAIIYVVTSHDLGGDILFGLFVVSIIYFNYEYRVQSVARITPKEYARHSLGNLILLTIIVHFTGGVFSVFSWFFPITLLSVIAMSGKRHLNVKVAWLTGFFIFEGAFAVLTGTAEPFFVLGAILPQYFVLIIAASYIRRTTALHDEIDEAFEAKNQEVTEALMREREAGKTIASQAKELAQAEAQLETVVSSVSNGVIAIGDNGKILFMNPASHTILRCVSEGVDAAMVDLSIFDMLPIKNDAEDIGNFLTILDSVLKSSTATYAGDDNTAGTLMPIPQGSYLSCGNKKKYLEGVAVDLGSHEGDVRMVITFSDVTYRQEVESLKTDFMSVAAHQLRTPLSSIRWFLELINDPEEGKLNANQKMFAENAYTSLIRMIGLVNGLLSVTRVETSRVPSNPEPVSVVNLTKHLVDEFKVEMKKKKLKVHIRTEGEIPLVKLDPQLSREVFMNLLSNAVRYSEESGEILISISDDAGSIHWSIQDNGIGIPKEYQDKIFNKFFRTPNATQHESKGTGLGLYLAKVIANQWGGSITFESSEGNGTTFHVTVPHAGMKAKKGDISLHS